MREGEIGITAHTVVMECIALITVEKQDYWIVENGTVDYSKYCGGGAYQCAFRYTLYELEFTIRPIIYGSPFGWKNGAWLSFDLNDPESFKRIGAAIRKIADSMHADRRPRL
jgi:hypothetical protein